MMRPENPSPFIRAQLAILDDNDATAELGALWMCLPSDLYENDDLGQMETVILEKVAKADGA